MISNSLKNKIDTIKLERFGLLGSIISAVIASACCIGPLLFAFLGLSGAGFLLKLSPYRPFFILATFSFLGIGFYEAYRKKPQACKIGSICANPISEKINKISLWAVTLIVIFLIIFPYVGKFLLIT